MGTLYRNIKSYELTRKFSVQIMINAIFSSFILIFSSLVAPSPPRNVVIILVDDLGWKDVGYAGSVLYHTPHLDSLSKEATVFTQAYSAHPVCSPSRAAIMTGKNPTRLGITDWIPGQRPPDRILQTPHIHNELKLEEKTIAEFFKEVGYRTFFAGKWHLGDEPHTPENQGFDINIGGIDKGSPPGGYYSPYKNDKLPDGPEGEYLTDRLTLETIDFIDKNKDQPFLAFLSYYTVHTPIQPSTNDTMHYEHLAVPTTLHYEHDAYTVLYQSNLEYASMVTAMDRNVGLLIDYLKKQGLWHNTIFVFTSDNGGLSTLERKRPAPTSNHPLRAGKGWCYEGGIRIPQIIHIPETSAENPIVEAPTIHQDILPTVWAAAGIDNPLPTTLDGINIFSESRSQDRMLYWDYPHYHGSGWTPGAAIREGDWKLILYYERDVTELYNLNQDPGETIDLSQRFPDLTQQMRKRLIDLIKNDQGQFPGAR